jgi:hypothetical protein
VEFQQFIVRNGVEAYSGAFAQTLSMTGRGGGRSAVPPGIYILDL